MNQMEKLLNKTFCFDIDGVICSTNCDYNDAIPNQKIIDKINYLHNIGHNIIINTSRGYKSGIDWGDFTKKQLEKWGVNYNKLLFTKPSADYYIDDRNISIENIINYEL
jgi:histidinol phosphatase-like enzyme